MAKKKQNTAFNVQVADFIRNHKKAGTAIDDEVTEKLVIPFVLDADGIDDLLERLTDGGISITDKDGNPSSKYVVEAPKPEELTDEELLADLDLLLMGDSIALGASDEFYAAFPNSICDAAVSRYTTESFDLYDSYVNEKGWAGDGVIFALGSNGLLYDSLGTMREKLGPDMPFFVFTARAPYTTWETSNN